MTLRCVGYLLLLGVSTAAQQPYVDSRHPSRVFSENRNYRIFLPHDYSPSAKRYPVIYYFHGHSDRYTLEKYDNGLDTVPKIAAFVAAHDVIVVAADGYVARDYTGFYGGTPYDVRRDGGDFDYGEYFLELVTHIDATYRTLPTRRYRATSGLSMGGFMSLYLSARYPDLVGSASAFNPGPEFYVGEKGRRSLWRPKDHTASHAQTSIRLIRASGDYISQYHEETRAAYAMAPKADFEFRQDEYHRHWATSIDETFEFHSRAFDNPTLDTIPTEWTYTGAQRRFDVYGYRVSADIHDPALITLANVTQGGLRVTTRQWAPDGPPTACSAIQVATAPNYRPASEYRLIDYALATSKLTESTIKADADGRIAFTVDCGGHQIGIAGPGTGAQPPVVLPLSAKDVLRVPPGVAVALPLRIFNSRGTPQNFRVELASAYPTVEILQNKAEWKSVAPGAVAEANPVLQVRFIAGAGDWAHARLQAKITYDDWTETTQPLDVLIAPDALPAPAEIAILDGQSRTFSVFHQKGNQGGGSGISRTVKEGDGNGNGILDPGERASIWIRLPQGLDPFDKNNWCRTKVYTDSPWLTEIADIQEEKQREWTGAQNRTSLVALAAKVPTAAIPVVLDCESWSFHFTPDVHYGRELLYQAFQFHKHHLFAWTWKSGQISSSEHK
ncbi:MAG: alpha/beta hydrolase [Bryobacteraceae bacterium]